MNTRRLGWAGRGISPRNFDIGVVVLLSLIGLVTLPSDRFLQGRHASELFLTGALAAALQVGQVIPLAWRRHHPEWVLVISVVAWAIAVAVGLVEAAGTFPLVIAVYSVSAYGSRVFRLIVGGLVGLLFAAALAWVGLTLNNPNQAAGYAGEAFMMTAGWLLGDYMRNRRAFRRGIEAQRLVAGQDSVRRRLERNLHDGAQQNLVALKVKLGLAQALLEKDPGKARALLDDIKADTDHAIEALRELSHGIYPPILADHGVVAALESQARRSPLPVEVFGEGVDRYPEDIESTIYFCCLEALQNIAKHAGASRVTINVGQSDGRVAFSVHDDGKGLDPETAARGAGLRNMGDRLAALGGDLDVQSRSGEGTTITGTIPATARPGN